MCPVIFVTAFFVETRKKKMQESLTQAQIPKSPTSTQKIQIDFCWPMKTLFEKKTGLGFGSSLLAIGLEFPVTEMML